MTEAVVTRRILLSSEADLLPLLGRSDENLKALESLLALRIVARGNEIILKGEEPRVARAERLLTQLSDLVHAGTPLHATDVRAALRMLADDETANLKGILLDTISVPSRKKQISPKTVNQKRYVDAIRTYDVVVAIGPAGTGKSYLGVAMAVSALTKREVARIILTRPAV
ncbi:MAG: PhoH family protein, partial [Candidatus Rokubacteria bacterium]|nr:PhoH family protein [Candidatus Rokubacteria bacterium]